MDKDKKHARFSSLKFTIEELETKQDNDMIDWWVGTVVLAFFPIGIALIMNVIINKTFDLQRIIGDGELVLSAFMVTTPSLINQFKMEKGRSKPTFYALLISSFLHLVAYTSIKINIENDSVVVYLTSIFCVLTSILLSWQGEEYLQGGKR